MSTIEFLWNVVNNLTADAIFASLVLVLLAAFHMRRRRRMRQFFALEGGTEVAILLSNMWVDRTRGVTPLQVGYTGPATALGEYLAATELSRVIERDSGVPRVLRFFVPDGETRRLGGSRVQVRFSPSYIDPQRPREPARVASELPESCLRDVTRLLSGDQRVILVGSQVYNAAVLYALERVAARGEERLAVTFVDIVDPDDPTGERTVRAVRAGPSVFAREERRTAAGEPRDVSYCVVGRVMIRADRGAPRIVFFCSGLSTAATMAALRLLADWEQLRQAAETEEFMLVYEVVGPAINTPEDLPPEAFTVTRVFPRPRGQAETPEIPTQRPSADENLQDAVEQ